MYNKILVAKIVATKGLKGELKLKNYAEDFLSLVKSPLIGECGTAYYLYDVYLSNKWVVTKIKGIFSQEEAVKLVGKSLYTDRNNLPPLENNNFYIVDLINAQLFNVDNQLIGSVKKVYNFGAGDIIEVTIGSINVMLPFNEETIIDVDVKNKKIILNNIYKEYINDKL